MPKTVNIIGLGASGRSAAELAVRLNFEIRIFDEGDSPSVRQSAEDLKQRLGAKLAINWSGGVLPKADLTVVSPGVPPNSILLEASKNNRAEMISELEFGFRYCETPILAITGTNGKTTTVELTTHILNSLDLPTASAGNIGKPLCDFAAIKSDPLECLVVEVSSFQLELCECFKPLASAILNINSDHLDRHGNLENYAKTKFKIFANSPSSKQAVINANLLGQWRKFGTFPDKKPVLFGTKTGGLGKFDFYLDENKSTKVFNSDGALLLDISESALRGQHNAENIMAAMALIEIFLSNINKKTFYERLPEIRTAIREFRAAEHRLEFVKEINGVRFINDSKATNPDAVIAALRSAGGIRNVCILLGGRDKNMDFTPICDESGKIKKAFIFGESAKKLLESLRSDMDCELFDDFESAVNAARTYASSGDVVLLSPGCASMDMFTNYRQRGECFKKILE